MKYFILIFALVACGASQRQKTIATTLHAVDVAETAFLAFDKQHQLDLVGHAANRDDGERKLTEWRAERESINKGFVGAYRAIAAAATLDDDPSVAGMVQAAAIVAQELAALGVKP